MDLNDYPSTKSIPWKPVAIGAAGLVVVIVLIVVIVRWIKSDDEMDALTQTVQEQVTASMDGCESALDPEGCRQGEITDLAAEHESVETCELLETVEERDNCYWGVARAASDASYCSAISVSEDADRCTEGIEARTAVHEDPLSLANCEDREPESCDSLRVSTRAIAALDRTLCLEIEDESDRDQCQENIEDELSRQDQDSDSDGLTDAQEETYATDPDNPDSDEDGYSDGDEVSAGYNPLGSGRL